MNPNLLHEVNPEAITLAVQNYNDRRELCAILSGAGYLVRVIEQREHPWNDPKYLVEVTP